jgi:hypothetical protein
MADMKKSTENGLESMAILPPGPGKCGICAGAHDPAQPHNKDSLYYRMKFRQQHGRYPNWTDAMEHCAPEVKAWWRTELTRRGISMEEAQCDKT